MAAPDVANNSQLKIVNALPTQADGNLALYGDKNREVKVWESGSDSLDEQSKYLQLVIQNDNNLVLYDSLEQTLWETNTAGQCG